MKNNEQKVFRQDGIPPRQYAFPFDGYNMNLVNMILNIESNNSNNFRKPYDVYTIYAEMKELNHNKDFQESLINSRECVKIPPFTNSNLSKLRENDPNSFLVLPLLGKGHLWSTMIRKTDEGFSALVINKGLRYWHDPVEEFVFKKENQSKLVDCLKHGGYSLLPTNVENVYRKFIEKSDKQFNVKIDAGPQKVGNCFTKNIQAGIKMAYSTRNIEPNKLRELRLPQEYTPYGTKNQGKMTFKWKTMSTEQMQKLFVEKVGQKNTSLKGHIDQSVGIYESNKHFREAIKKNGRPLESFINAFDPKDLTRDLPINERVKKLMHNITPYTYETSRKQVNEVVSATREPGYMKVYNDLNRFSEMGKASNLGLRLYLYIDAKHDTMKSLSAVYDREGKLNNMPINEKAKVLLAKVDESSLIIFGNKIKPVIAQVYGAENVEKVYNDLLVDARIAQREIAAKAPNKEEIKLLKQIFPIIVDKVNHRISEYQRIISEDIEKRNMEKQNINQVEPASTRLHEVPHQKNRRPTLNLSTQVPQKELMRERG